MGKASIPADSRGLRVTSDTIVRPAEAPWPPAYRLTPEILAAARRIERLDEDLRLHQADEQTRRRLVREALARNAYGTASIEGNPLTLEQVESLLDRGPSPSTLTEPDEREILNYAAILEDLDRTPLPRSVAQVEALHRRLFSGVLPAPGRLKTRANFVGDRRRGHVAFLPTEPRRARKELADALRWLHEAREFPLTRVALFFHEFQSIHPFADGNGRLGRLLTTVALWTWGYKGAAYAPIDFAINEDRQAYYEALDAARQSGWDRTPWLAYYLRVLESAYARGLDRFRVVDALPAGLNDRQVRLVEWFARMTRTQRIRAVKFNDVHAAFPTIPRRTLTHDLRLLSDRALVERDGVGKGTTYRYPGRSRPAPRERL